MSKWKNERESGECVTNDWGGMEKVAWSHMETLNVPYKTSQRTFSFCLSIRIIMINSNMLLPATNAANELSINH